MLFEVRSLSKLKDIKILNKLKDKFVWKETNVWSYFIFIRHQHFSHEHISGLLKKSMMPE
jgi:hypothetical protein